MLIKNNIPIVLIIIVTIIFLFPLYWMIIASFKDMNKIFESVWEFLPIHSNLKNYGRLFLQNPVIKWFANSLFVAGMTTIVVVLTNSMAGYAIAKKKFYGKMVMFWVIMGTLMLPRQVLIVPMFLLMRDLNLFGTYSSIVLPAMAWPIGIFLMKQFMQTLPTEILESSRMDGCSEVGTFFKMVIPLSKPVIAALSIFTFMSVWNDYLWQVIIINNSSFQTLPLGIALLQNEFVPDYGILFAGAAIGAVPMIIVFLSFQKYFTAGITLGAVKG